MQASFVKKSCNHNSKLLMYFWVGCIFWQIFPFSNSHIIASLTDFDLLTDYILCRPSYIGSHYLKREKNLYKIPLVPGMVMIPLRIATKLSMLKYQNITQNKVRKAKILKIHHRPRLWRQFLDLAIFWHKCLIFKHVFHQILTCKMTT